jgi:hypothetical protein
MTVKTLYSSISGVTGVISLDSVEGYNTLCRNLTVECVSTTLDIGDDIVVDAGFSDNHGIIFTGIVKKVNKTTPNNTVKLTCLDTLVKANDFFLVAEDPDVPFSRSNIDATDLVGDLLAEAGITTFSADPTNFIFTDPSFNLVSISDAIGQINAVIVYHIWCDETGTIHFADRRPYIMGGDTPTFTFTTGSSGNIITNDYTQSEEDLRNKVVVYGKEDIVATASASSPYLPDGFYKTAVVASPLISPLQMAQDSADFNLVLFNRLTKTVSCEALGDHTLHVNSIVTVTEPTTGVTGDWFVFSVSHSWGESGYTMRMVLKS